MGRILRYHTDGLGEDADGFVKVDELLRLPDFQGVERERMHRVAAASVGSRGPRFELRGGEADAALEVRALYQHPPDERRRPRRGFQDGGGLNGRRGGFSNDSEGNQYRDIRGGVTQTRGGFSRPPCEDLAANGHEDAEIDWTAQWGDGRRLRTVVKDGASAVSEVSAAAKDLPPKLAPPNDASNESNRASGDVEAEGLVSTTATPASSDAIPSTAEVWERYNEPETQRVWFWNTATEEVFWADDLDSGWEQYFGSQGQPWWFNEAEGRFFHEET
jgi:hypothetical protein